MHELEKVTPLFLMAEDIEMPDGTIINQPDSVKYLGVTNSNLLHVLTYCIVRLIVLAGSPSDGRSSGRQIIFNKQHLTGVVTLTISVPLVF